MLQHVSHVNVWVTDQDEALTFYVDKLGLEPREDVTPAELGGFRWLTVGVPGLPDVALALIVVPEPPVFDGDTKQLLETLLAKGVEFVQEPTEQPYGVDAGIRDPFGNQIRLVERMG